MYGFAKSQLDNIEPQELKALKRLAKELFSYNDNGINKAIKVKEIIENFFLLVLIHNIKLYRFSHKDFGKAPDQNYPQAYNSTLRTNFYLGTKSKIFMTKSVLFCKICIFTYLLSKFES